MAYNIHMTLNDLFKAGYGKEWQQASFAEKLKAAVFGVLLFQFPASFFV